MKYNLACDTDAYKYSHFLMFPPDTTSMFSYIEARGGDYGYTVAVGLQMLLQHYFSDPVTLDDIVDARDLAQAQGMPFNSKMWARIVDTHGGRLPIRIRAVAEGSVVGVGNALVTIESTDPECYPLVGHMETALMRLWYPMAVATRAHAIKRDLYKALKKSGDTPLESLPYMLWDFGSRSVSCPEQAGIGGCAHLTQFVGSDTNEGQRYARRYYGAIIPKGVPAAEHSTITAWGREGEVKAYSHILDQFAKPGGLVSIVADSYDINFAVDEIFGVQFKERIKNSGATVVIRPDSGEPVEMVYGVVQQLMGRFGYNINSKGYKVLPSYVRVLQGDGVSQETIQQIIAKLHRGGLSLDNVATFGMGTKLLQDCNRDTQKFAMKCSSVTRNGKEQDVYKDPCTDRGKQSKRGRLSTVIMGDGSYFTARLLSGRIENQDEHEAMETIYENGQLLKIRSMNEVRKRGDNTLLQSVLD